MHSPVQPELSQPELRIDLAARLKSPERIILELGCGDKEHGGRIGIDHLPLPFVDIVANLEMGLPFFPDNSVDEIHSQSLLAHLQNFEGLIRECVRVLKPGGRNHLFVPHFSNPYFYSDYTHRRSFGLYTFQYFVDPAKQMQRKVPAFYSNIRLRIVKQRMVFSSPFRSRRWFKKLVEWGVNLHPRMQEFYEENLCYLIPCYGIEVEFEKDC